MNVVFIIDCFFYQAQTERKNELKVYPTDTAYETENKRCIESASRLLWYDQLPGKNSRDIPGICVSFCGVLKFLFVYSMISRGTPDIFRRTLGFREIVFGKHWSKCKEA
jgi:hypothetical protein